jgi:hypothetical protein
MRLQPSTTTPSLFSITTQTALIQIVATSRGVVLDVQATNIATDGRAHQCHATAKLALDEAVRLEDILRRSVDAAWDCEPTGRTERTDERQTALWSPATFTAPRAA